MQASHGWYVLFLLINEVKYPDFCLVFNVGRLIL